MLCLPAQAYTNKHTPALLTDVNELMDACSTSHSRIHTGSAVEGFSNVTDGSDGGEDKPD